MNCSPSDLRPAAIEAGVELEPGQRFGFHNLRHSLVSFLLSKKKTDVKTVQRSLRHAKSTTTLDQYTQTDMHELIAAQEMMLDAIFSPCRRACELEWIQEWIKTGLIRCAKVPVR